MTWLDEHNVHAYAVLANWELEPLRARFKGQRLFERLEKSVFTLTNSSFYDLASSTPITMDTTEMTLPRRKVLGVPPAKMPMLVLKR